MNTAGNRWTKVLYQSQPYPDNYTEKATFLRDLRTEVRPAVPLFKVISGAALFLQEVCVVIGFVITYVHMKNEWVEPQTVLIASTSLTMCGLILNSICYNKLTAKQIANHLRTVLIFIVFGHLFSPVLHTLTDTVSTDSIYSMSFYMMIIHLIVFDYGAAKAAVVSNCVSLSASLFASLCLISRLRTPYEAFILFTVAIELFVLFPIFRKQIKYVLIVSCILVIIDSYFLLQISKQVLMLFLTVAGLILVAFPILFAQYYCYKTNIYGPWDEAVVHRKSQ